MRHNLRAVHCVLSTCVHHTHAPVDHRPRKRSDVAYEGHQICYPCMIDKLEGYAAKFRDEEKGGTLFARWADMYQQRADSLREMALTRENT